MRKQMDMKKELNDECKRYAKKEGMTLNGFVTRCIEKGLAYYKAKNITIEEMAHKQSLGLDDVTEAELRDFMELTRKLFVKP